MKNAVILENVYGFNSVKATDIRIISSFLFLCKQTSHTQAHLTDTLSSWVRQFLRIKLFASSKTTFNSIQFQWEMYSSMRNKKIIERLFHTCVAFRGSNCVGLDEKIFRFKSYKHMYISSQYFWEIIFTNNLIEMIQIKYLVSSIFATYENRTE